MEVRVGGTSEDSTCSDYRLPVKEPASDHCRCKQPAKMSHEATEQTKLGPGFDVTSISGAGATIYVNDVDMEDTASNSVRFTGETIPKSNESSLGLTPPDVSIGEFS